MRDWDSFYREKGILKTEPSMEVVKAAEFFRKEKAKRILDLGCGTGRHIKFLSKEGFEVYGCDASGSALRILRKTAPGMDLKKCDMTCLPYAEGFFDGVLSHQVIQHGMIADIRKAVNEIFRVLGEGGVLVLRVVSTKHDEYQTGKEIEPNTKINIDSPIDGHMPHHYFTKEEIREFFTDFEIINLKHVLAPSGKDPKKMSGSWVMYAKKPASG
jgi:ubiquinone/menaquinone biosynthesis C-methylase UbiE